MKPAVAGLRPGALERLGLRRRFDFVLHLPLRYEDETALTAPQAAPPGRPVQIEAKVERAKVEFRPKRQLIVHADNVVLRFFHFYGSQVKQFQRAAEEGLRVRAFGEVRAGWFGAEMAHPRYRIVREGEPLPDALTPIYPATAGLSQAKLRERVLQELDSAQLDDTLPDALRQRYALAGFAESVKLLHRPPPGADLALHAGRSHPAWRRMKFDELLAQQLSMRFAYRERRARQAPALPGNGALLKSFFKSLPFKLTRSQSRAAGEVLRDLAVAHPMQRLLQGDVGSGKTIVAAIACLAAVDAGGQAAVMAPTEILSEQHSTFESSENGSRRSECRSPGCTGPCRGKRKRQRFRRSPQARRRSSSARTRWCRRVWNSSAWRSWWSMSSTASASSSVSCCEKRAEAWSRTN